MGKGADVSWEQKEKKEKKKKTNVNQIRYGKEVFGRERGRT